jgi:hypothetical protein
MNCIFILDFCSLLESRLATILLANLGVLVARLPKAVAAAANGMMYKITCHVLHTPLQNSVLPSDSNSRVLCYFMRPWIMFR